VRSRRVSSTQASIRRVSRRSEFPSKGEGLAVGGDTICLGGMGVVMHSLVLAFLVGGFLGAAETFGAGFLLLVFLLVLFTAAFLGASVISVGVGGCTRLQSLPRLICSGDSWGRAQTVKTSRGCAGLRYRPRRCLPYKRRLRFLPLSAVPVLRGVVSSAATAFKLFFGC
jgi:hypothetical protein